MKLWTYVNISVPSRLLCVNTIISGVVFPLFMMDYYNLINLCVKER